MVENGTALEQEEQKNLGYRAYGLENNENTNCEMKYRVTLIEPGKDTIIYVGWNEGVAYLYYEALVDNRHERDSKKLMEQGKESFV